MRDCAQKVWTPYDEQALARALATVRALPPAPDLDALDDANRLLLAGMQQLGTAGGELDVFVEVLMILVGAARRLGTADLRSHTLDTAVGALRYRYGLRGDPADVDRQISLQAEAVEVTADHPHQAHHLYMLGETLRSRGKCRASALDLDLALRMFGEALARLTAPNERARCLNTMALAREDRYDLLGDPTDLDQWLRLDREAIRLADDAQILAPCLANLARGLRTRFALRGEATDLDRAYEAMTLALGLSSPGPGRADLLINLGNVLAERYFQSGDPDVLARWIETAEAALADAPAGSGRVAYLQTLAVALGERYARSGDPADLERRIALLQEAIQIGGPGGALPEALTAMVAALIDRFDRLGAVADLDAAIGHAADAVRRTPSGPDRPGRLHNLAIALGCRYRAYGDAGDLTRQIALLEEAAGPGLSTQRPMILRSLANALGERHQRYGEEADLDRRVALAEESAQMAPAGGGRIPYLVTLSTALMAHYYGRGVEADLERSLALDEEALALAPAGPARSILLHNQAAALWERYKLRQAEADRDRCIALLAQALDGTGIAGKPDRAFWLARLCLQRASARDGAARVPGLLAAAQALETGVDALETMLSSAPEATVLALLERCQGLYAGLVDIRLELAEATAALGDDGQAEAHRRLAYLAAERSKGRRTAALLAAPSGPVAPEAAPLVREAEELRRELAKLLSRRAGDAPEESEFAAHGERWLQSLREQTPDLARRHLPAEAPPAHVLAVMGVAARVGDLWERLKAVLERVARADPAYATLRGFAEPQPLEAVAAALPEGGALALLYPLEDRLACFVVRAGQDGQDPPVPHPAVGIAPLTRAELSEMVERIFPSGVEGLPIDRGDMLDAALLKLGRALHPALGPLLPPAGGEQPPALVLVPTGPLHRLPLHACPWPHRAHGRLLDLYTVSYATSADVLVLSGARAAAASGLVALAPGHSPAGGEDLPAALAEAATVAQASGGRCLLRRQASTAALLRDRVATNTRWVLFATHGRASADPSWSGLLFSDEGSPQAAWLTAAEILTLLDLDGVEHLALSACATHAVPQSGGDELTGLVRALLFRGARSVQLTLWPVDDAAAALVGVWTWERLLAGEPDKAAALNAAVRRLRTCSGEEAASALHRLASALPAGDPARATLTRRAEEVVRGGHPFAHPVFWAPFVLHGASRIAASP